MTVKWKNLVRKAAYQGKNYLTYYYYNRSYILTYHYHYTIKCAAIIKRLNNHGAFDNKKGKIKRP